MFKKTNTNAHILDTDTAVQALKIPPHSIEAEQSVIGGLLMDNHVWDTIADRLAASDFYRPEHRTLFLAIEELVARQHPFDLLTVLEVLKSHRLLENIGNESYLYELARSVPSVANIVAYADIIRERSVMRQLITVATEIADSAFNPKDRSSDILLSDAENKLFAIAEKRYHHGDPVKSSELMAKTFARLTELEQSSEPMTGVPTGFVDLDKMTSGLQSGDLIIVAARPSMGKTTFAMNVAENVLMCRQKPVLVFSMEMSAEQLALRLISSWGRVNQHHLRTANLTQEEWGRVSSAVGAFSQVPLYLDDTSALSPTEVRARARRLMRQCNGELGLILIDYLQLMQIPGCKEGRTTEISHISRSLKSLARELNVPIVALSQLNRSLEGRSDRRPVMSDLRECVIGDTLVQLADGRQIPISHLVGQSVEILSLDSNKKIIKAQCEKIWQVGKKQTYKITCESGRTLRATQQHQVMTAQGWSTVANLSIRDKIATTSYVSPLSLSILKNTCPIKSLINDIIWDKVVQVTPYREEIVYDLTVPGPAAWLSNGIVSHNSGAIEQDADVILFIYRDEVYNNLSPDRGTAEIIISKQRNGPIGKVKLKFSGEFTRFENLADGVYTVEATQMANKPRRDIPDPELLDSIQPTALTPAIIPIETNLKEEK